MKKVKFVFIDRYYPRYETFQKYQFDKRIESRIHQPFGWSFDIIKEFNGGERYEICVHIISSNYLIKHGITQHFYSKHGPKYDDKYSYLHGMNILSFEGRSRVHIVYTLNKIIQLFSTTVKPEKRTKRIEELEKKEYSVPVDVPRLGILTTTTNIKENWVTKLTTASKKVLVSDDITKLVPVFPQDEFIEYSLSRNYSHTIKDYIDFLENIIKLLWSR